MAVPRPLVVSLFAALLLVAVAGLAPAVSRGAAPAACGKVLPPAQGVYFGIRPGWDFQLPWFDDAVNAWNTPQFVATTVRQAAIVAFRTSWHDTLVFPTGEVELLWREGYVPQLGLVNWPVQDYGAPQPALPGPFPNSAIAAGAQDDALRRYADAARNTDIPIEFVYDQEMQAAHPWGGRFDGGGATSFGDPTWPDGPEHYRDAYRHIIDIFRQERATNVTFIFQTNTIDGGYQPGSYWEPWEQMNYYYPGDDYIDWIGLSAYSEPLFNTGAPQTFEHKLLGGADYQGSYAEITSLTAKPLMINEMGLYHMPSEDSKAQWVEDASTVMQSGEFPRIKGLIWWGDKSGDYEGYPSSSTFLAGFKQAFDQPFFDAKAQFSGDCRPLASARATLNSRTLRWTAIPNAAAYEVWQAGHKLTLTQITSLRVSRPGPYRVRGVNLVGYGPFTTAR
jgi:hypothetical protein